MSHNNIIFHSSILQIYEKTKDYCLSLGYETPFIDELWEGLILHQGLFDEYIYFLNHHEFEGSFVFEGYNLYDLYFFEMRNFNLRHDLGRNLSECDKDEVSILAFHTMGQFIQNPAHYKAKFEKGMGMDFL